MFDDSSLLIMEGGIGESQSTSENQKVYNLSTDLLSKKSVARLFENAAKDMLKKNTVPFSPEYRLDNDEVYVIEDYELPGCVLDALKNSIKSSTYSPSKDYDANVIVLGNSDGKEVAFQKVDRGQHLSNKFCLMFNSNTFHENKSQGLIVKESITCLYYEGNLYFKSFNNTNQIFNVERWYEIASEEAVHSFVVNPMLSLEDSEFFQEGITRATRRNLLLIEKNKVMERGVDGIKKVADSKGFHLKIVNNKIIIPSDKRELKLIMGFLTDKVFRAGFSNDIFLANSVQKFVQND